MGLLSSSKKSTSNVSETNTSNAVTDQRVASDNSIIGGNVSANSIGSVVQSDYGSIEKAIELSQGALDAATLSQANSFTFADTAMTNSLLFGGNALQLASESQNLVAQIAGSANDKAYDFAAEANKNASGTIRAALDAVVNGNDRAFDFGETVTQKLESAVSNANNNIAAVVKQANTSDSVQTIQYIAGAIIAVAVVFLLINKGK